ncbi:MAG: hypothetical protein QOC63_657 [Mycobacterium sp.]|jgi:hypothetical protein|nr:hypothetical protein [Mycobacterium sp.]
MITKTSAGGDLSGVPAEILGIRLVHTHSSSFAATTEVAEHAEESGRPVVPQQAALLAAHNTMAAGPDWGASSPSARAMKRLRGSSDALG